MGAVWRHGDWIQIGAQEDGGCVILAVPTPPSTATACAWARASSTAPSRPLPEVLDSLVVDLEYLGRESYMPLFVVLRPG